MASIKLLIFFFHLLISSYVFAHDPELADIECPCKDGKVMNCEGGHRMGGGMTKKDKEEPAPAPDDAGGKGGCDGKGGGGDAGKDAADDAAGTGGADAAGGKGNCDGKGGGGDAGKGGADAAAAGKGGDDAAGTGGADAAGGKGNCDGKGGGGDAGKGGADAAGKGGDDAAGTGGADAAGGKGNCDGKGGGGDAGKGGADAAGKGGDDAAGTGGADAAGGKGNCDGKGGGGDAGKGGADAAGAGKGGDDAAGTGGADAAGGKGNCDDKGGGGDAGKGGADDAAAGKGGDDAAGTGGADAAGGKGNCDGKGGGGDAGKGGDDAAGTGGADAAGGKGDCDGKGGGGDAGKGGAPAPAGGDGKDAGGGGKDAGGKDAGKGGDDAAAGKGGDDDAADAGKGGDDDAADAGEGGDDDAADAGKGGDDDAADAGKGGDDAAGKGGAAAPAGGGGKDAGGGDAGKGGAPAPAGGGGKDAGGGDAGKGGAPAPAGGGGKDAGGKDAGGGDDAGKGGAPAPAGGGGKDAGGDDAGKGGAPAPAGGDDKEADDKGKDADDKGKDAPALKPGGLFDPALYGQPPIETDYKGEWAIHNPDVGVNAMQYQLMPNSKAVWIDTTNLGPSTLELGPKGNCPPNPDNNNEPDCFAHGLQYDTASGEITPVYVRTDPWCSSGHMLPNGDMLSTGGNRMGDRSVRLFKLNDPEAKFIEREQALGAARWYASNCVLEDGGAIIVGGRDSYSYDIIPPAFEFQPTVIDFPFLQQTTEPAVQGGLHVENNLYPFVYLIPDGNVFIFANDRAIRFNPKTGEIIKEYPVLEGGSRNYPPSGQSALLPLRLSPDNAKPVPAVVVVCGGNKRDAFPNIDARYTQNRVFSPALQDCNRIDVMADNPAWVKDQDMPSPRTMGDLLALPNAQYLLINGAKKGTSGWDDGEDPNFTPTVYMPDNEMGNRFKELQPTNIARMYHSTSSVLPDGKILVAGSNAHQFYTFDGPFPTELRTEKFSPHYLDPKLDENRPVITEDATDKVLKYGQPFKVTFTIASGKNLGYGDVLLTLIYPPFTTHGFSQNQRLIITGIDKVDNNVIAAIAPPSGKIAPPGYYMMFVNNLNVPSQGIWVHVD